MKRWFDDGDRTKAMSTQDGSDPFSRLRRVVPQILMIAGVVSVMTSCSKISLPPTTQDGTTPAAAPSAGPTAFNFLPSFDNPPAPVSAAPPGAASAPTAAAPASGPTQAPTAVVKVHPAMGAKEAAMKMYPQLAVKDSTFNKVFRDLYAEEMQRNPDLLTRADWPLTLAHHTADLLARPVVSTGRAVPARSGSAAPEMAQARPTRATPTPPTALNRGAYNQTRSPYYWWPWVRYY